MACKRDRLLRLKEYIQTQGIELKVGKNCARGHKGIFVRKFGSYRIDISKQLSDDEILSVLLHEYAHFVHYKYDKNLTSLDFVFGKLTDDIKEELINVTVNGVSKAFATELYNKKYETNNEIKELTSKIKKQYPDFKLSEKYKKLELGLLNPVKYLLKYDCVNYYGTKYSIDKIDEYSCLSPEQRYYIKLRSKQRFIKRINSKINRLNKYYNNPSELFARFIELYYTDEQKARRIAPQASLKLRLSNIKLLEPLNLIMQE